MPVPFARASVRADLAVALACLVAFLLVTWYVNSPVPSVGNRMFGWEYGYVADSLASGRGFSDPFGVPSPDISPVGSRGSFSAL